MTPAEFIAAVRHADTDVIPGVFESLYAFSYTNKEKAEYDANAEYRKAIVRELLHDFSLKDIHLIRSLFHHELDCADWIYSNDNLHQLCYYLYELAQLEDVFNIYNARSNAITLEAGGTFDREMLSLRHSVDTVRSYVAHRFTTDPPLESQYPQLMQDLRGLIEYPTYSDLNDYTKYVRTYYRKKID